jgi:acetyltransferase
MGGRSVEEGRRILAKADVATYATPDRAVRAFAYLVEYKRNRETLYETPRSLPIEKSLNKPLEHTQLNRWLAEGRNVLTEIESKALLAAYGVPVAAPTLAHTARDAVHVARQLGYPVVMKIQSPQITHKTEVQGVVTGVSNDNDVRLVFQDVINRARRLQPDAEIDGVTVQHMYTSPEGIELIVGATHDPVFGAVMMLGAGGVTAELLHDRTLELPPLNERLARRMFDSLRIRPVLEGYRGSRPINKDRLVEVLMRLSYVVADHPAIAALDVNPLMATPEAATALDARVILNPQMIENPPPPYSHLAIRPYPEEYIRYSRLRDGAQVLLRPIQPEDETLWLELLSRCSARSLRRRFRYLFKETAHETATRFCFIDYDRTMTIVADVDMSGSRQLVGVGRLVADADHCRSKYAVLVADAWQGRGLGALLTDYCLEICRTWGIDQVVAEMAADNRRMQRILARRGFETTRIATKAVICQKCMAGGIE